MIINCNSETSSTSETQSSTSKGIDCPEDADCIPGTDRCPDSCYRDRYVFVMNTRIKGYEIGGIEGANDKCNEAAKNSGLFSDEEILNRPVRAWLSDTDSDAYSYEKFGKGRLILPQTPYEKVNKINSVYVSESLRTLVSTGKLDHPINRDEFGNELLKGYVWSNTNSDGIIISSENKGTCNHWQTVCWDNAPCEGLVGQIGSVNSEWTAISPPINASFCGEKNYIYCLETLWDAP